MQDIEVSIATAAARMKKDIELLASFKLQGWGDCGLTEEGGYLYPITHREGGYMDSCLSLERVVEILYSYKYRIRDDGYIDLWL